MSREVAGSIPAAPKLHAIGRADLSPGLRVAQMFHALRQFASDYPFVESEWYRNSNTIVLLEAPDGEALQALADKAREKGATVTEFSEPDFLDVGITALALGPDAWRLVSSLPLALRPTTAPAE